MGRTHPFIPMSGSDAGLLEKRLPVASYLDLSDSAELVGEWDRSASSTMLLDSDAEYHKNNAEDPATDSINMSDTVASVWDYNRGITQNVSLSNRVHVAKDGISESISEYTLTANETVVVGNVVYVSGDNTVNLGDASALTTSHVIGLVIQDATSNQATIVRTDGEVSRADWTAVVGAATLTPGAEYYLSTTAGQMTTTPPTGDGESVVRLGVAITTTKFDIEVNEIAVL